MRNLIKKILREGLDDFEWASGFWWSKKMLNNMLDNCKPLRVANFNIRTNKPYISAGGPSIMFLTRCKEWWDYFSQIPLSDSGRGTAEWFTPEYWDWGHYGIVWNHHLSERKQTPTLEMIKDNYTSAITTEWDYGIEQQLNGTSSAEVWFVVDENNKPIYDLIPYNVHEYAKIYEDFFFGDKLNESDDFDWIKEIPGTKGYGQKYKYFEIIACYGVDYETEECDDPYSHYIRIPIEKSDEIWSGFIGYFGGPGDEGAEVISYAIDSGLIPSRELLEIIMFEGVVEVSDMKFEEKVSMPDDLNESDDFDWIRDTPGLLRIEDLVGYYFKYDKQDRDYSIVGTHTPNHGGPDKLISYRWIDVDVVDGRDMLGDTFIHRVKNNSYTLYDKKSNLVDPNILVYSDNTLDDDEDERKEVWEQKTINESEDEWNWAKETQPIELQDPKEWVGMSFGYGKPIIDEMENYEIEQGHDKEYFTITRIDKNGNLSLIKTHPLFGDSDDSSTSVSNLRSYIGHGLWVWI